MLHARRSLSCTLASTNPPCRPKIKKTNALYNSRNRNAMEGVFLRIGRCFFASSIIKNQIGQVFHGKLQSIKPNTAAQATRICPCVSLITRQITTNHLESPPNHHNILERITFESPHF